MNKEAKILLVFVDGLGVGDDNPARNPIYSGSYPNICLLLDEHCMPIDACMGVEGVPQSATGQTSLLTGINAAKAVGRHIEGFPGAGLKALIREHNVFKQFSMRNMSSTFANAYYVDDVREVESSRIQSVTTVATLSAFGRVRDKHDMMRNEAVYQDLTREALKRRGYNGSVISPEDAGAHLVSIARSYDLTLFEYFQTDRAGHSGDMPLIDDVLKRLDGFLASIVSRVDGTDILLLLTSDHGNIEDISIRGHTRNPVPLVTLGKGAEQAREAVASIVDVVPALLGLAAGRTKS